MKRSRRILVNIGVLAAVCLAGVFCPLQAQHISWLAPSSNDEQDKALFYAQPDERWEIFAGPVVSLQPLADAQNYKVTDWLYGLEGGGRFYFTRAIAAAIGGQYFPSPRKEVPFTSSLHSEVFYAALRVYPMPNSLPFLWVEGGAGYMQTAFKLELFSGSESKLSGAVFFAGVGDCFSLGRGWKLDFSFRLLYMQKTDFDFLYHYPSRSVRQAAVFLSKRF